MSEIQNKNVERARPRQLKENNDFLPIEMDPGLKSFREIFKTIYEKTIMFNCYYH